MTAWPWTDAVRGRHRRVGRAAPAVSSRTLLVGTLDIFLGGWRGGRAGRKRLANGGVGAWGASSWSCLRFCFARRGKSLWRGDGGNRRDLYMSSPASSAFGYLGGSFSLENAHVASYSAAASGHTCEGGSCRAVFQPFLRSSAPAGGFGLWRTTCGTRTAARESGRVFFCRPLNQECSRNVRGARKLTNLASPGWFSARDHRGRTKKF